MNTDIDIYIYVYILNVKCHFYLQTHFFSVNVRFRGNKCKAIPTISTAYIVCIHIRIHDMYIHYDKKSIAVFHVYFTLARMPIVRCNFVQLTSDNDSLRNPYRPHHCIMDRIERELNVLRLVLQVARHSFAFLALAILSFRNVFFSRLANPQPFLFQIQYKPFASTLIVW